MTTVTVRLVGVTCCTCGVIFGIESNQDDNLRNDHRTFYCPNGHGQSYTGKTDAEVERARNAELSRRLDAARSLAQREADRRAAAQRKARAYKGVATRLKNRVANGVCPACTRSFPNLHDHMTTEHPDYAEVAP